jgi:hypothetical protein
MVPKHTTPKIIPNSAMSCVPPKLDPLDLRLEYTSLATSVAITLNSNPKAEKIVKSFHIFTRSSCPLIINFGKEKKFKTLSRIKKIDLLRSHIHKI